MKTILVTLVLVITSLSVKADESSPLLNYQSQHSVSQTTSQLVKTLKSKGFKIFSKIDHSGNAKKNAMILLESQLVIFGNPKIGSLLMKCSPEIAIDLPQKALIRLDKENRVWLSFNNPAYLKRRHKVVGCDKVFSKIENALNLIANSVTK